MLYTKADFKLFPMSNQLVESEIIVGIRKCMRGWSLCPKQYLTPVHCDTESIHFSCSDQPMKASTWGTGLFGWSGQLYALSRVFYLLDIQIAEEHRGNGHGSSLYRIIEQIASYFHCIQIRQTPSGRTYDNKDTRLNYLLRRGWIQDGTEVYKDLRDDLF